MVASSSFHSHPLPPSPSPASSSGTEGLACVLRGQVQRTPRRHCSASWRWSRSAARPSSAPAGTSTPPLPRQRVSTDRYIRRNKLAVIEIYINSQVLSGNQAYFLLCILQRDLAGLRREITFVADDDERQVFRILGANCFLPQRIQMIEAFSVADRIDKHEALAATKPMPLPAR